METSLHRALKDIYADRHSRLEVAVDGYRIDVVRGDQLIEIQHGSLAAIRDKIRRLLDGHDVLVVKPIVVRRLLVRRRAKKGRVVARRQSPKRGKILDLFHDLVYFTTVFPHPRLALEVPLVDVEEWRYPGHGRRRRWRARDFQTEDQKLLAVHEIYRFETAADLGRLVGGALPRPFHTGHLAQSLDVDRWVAQRIAYCLRKMGSVVEVGKQGNAMLYQFPESDDAQTLCEARRRTG
jgi:hypothetical protein